MDIIVVDSLNISDIRDYETYELDKKIIASFLIWCEIIPPFACLVQPLMKTVSYLTSKKV